MGLRGHWDPGPFGRRPPLTQTMTPAGPNVAGEQMRGNEPEPRTSVTVVGPGKALSVVAALLLVASAAFAAVTVTYKTNALTIKAAPIIWSGGPDSSGNNFVSSFALGANKTFFTVTLKPVPEATVTWGNFTTLENQDASAYTVTVSGDSVSSNAKILTFHVEFRNYGTDALVATLNLKEASPSASLGSVAAAAKLYTKVYLKLDTGTNAADLPSSVGLSLTAAP